MKKHVEKISFVSSRVSCIFLRQWRRRVKQQLKLPSKVTH